VAKAAYQRLCALCERKSADESLVRQGCGGESTLAAAARSAT